MSVAISVSVDSRPPLRFFNTLGRRLETFEPLEAGQVRMYTCGPTVYAAPHIGNLRTFLFEDLLRRTLRWFGYRVEQAMNLTDVEDKIIAAAQRQGVDIATYTDPHIAAFFCDLGELAIEPAEHYPRATDHVADMIAMIEALVGRDCAYQADGSVYFRIGSFAEYGRLSGVDLTQARRGERVADDEYGKDDARDFVLWKAAKPGEPSWSSPFGPGRPGWHIECSAMSKALLGETFDIHCGGVDNIFPHHENELAQSECANGTPFVRYWLHAEHLLVDGEKMSKSLGNQYTRSDLVARGIAPRALRYLLLSVHYRHQLNFTFDSAATASAALERLDQMRYRLDNARTLDTTTADDLVEAGRRFEQHFATALADDLNVSGALGALFSFSHEVNRRVDQGVTVAERAAVVATLESADRVLGVLDAGAWRQREAPGGGPGVGDDEVEALVAERTAARGRRDFAEADRIRDRLAELGITLEDGPTGTRWRRS